MNNLQKIITLIVFTLITASCSKNEVTYDYFGTTEEGFAICDELNKDCMILINNGPETVFKETATLHPMWIRAFPEGTVKYALTIKDNQELRNYLAGFIESTFLYVNEDTGNIIEIKE